MKKLLFLLLALPALAGKVPLVVNEADSTCSQTVDFTAASLEGVAAVKNKWDGTTAPTANEDSGDGYAVGSQWVDTTADKTYFCQDASVGAAVWKELSASAYDPASVAITGGTVNGVTIGGVTPGAVTATTATANAFIPNSATVPANGLYLPAANAVGLATNTTERMRITSAGDVGIGTNNPGEKLTVYDASTVYSSLRVATVGLISVSNGSSCGVYTDGAVPYTIGTNSTERVRITSGGNVLINTTSEPATAARLVVKGSTADGSTDAQSWQDSTGAEIAALDTDGNLVLGGYLLPGDTSSTTAGAIRYHSGALEGYVGGSWLSLTAGAAGGEANTASNVGSAGVGLYKQKTSVDLEFYKVLGSAGVSFALNGTDYADVKLDVAGLTEDTTPDVTADFVATYDASASANKKVKLEKLATTGVYRTLWLDSGAMVPRTTNGCAARASTESSTNKVMNDLFDFDKDADEFCQIRAVMPDEWDRGTVKVKFYWTAASGSGDVVWGVQGVALSNDDAIDTAFGTAQTATDTLITANDIHVTSATSAVTIAGTPALADVVYLQIYRDADAGGDTLDVDARLIGVCLQYKESTQAAGW